MKIWIVTYDYNDRIWDCFSNKEAADTTAENLISMGYHTVTVEVFYLWDAPTADPQPEG